MTLSDKERKNKVLELYHVQHKNTRDIVKEMRMSLKTIGAILREDKEEKEREREKVAFYNGGNGDTRLRPLQPEQQQSGSGSDNRALSTTIAPSLAAAELSDKEKTSKAYQLYDEGKSPVQVAIQLCLSEIEATRLYKEFWKLKRLYRLYQIYPEIEPYLSSFVRLHKECKRHGLNANNINDFIHKIEIGTIKLPEVEDEYETAGFKLDDIKKQVKECQNQFNNIAYHKQQLEEDIQYQKRMANIDLQNIRNDISDLTQTQDQLQQSVDFLGEEMMRRYNETKRLEEAEDTDTIGTKETKTEVTDETK